MSTSAAHRHDPEENVLSENLEALLSQRYGVEKKLSTQGQSTDVIGSVLSHRSVRSFLPDPVPNDVLELAIAAAQSASSSSNLQAWSVIAVEDKAKQERINAVAGNQRQIKQAPLLLIWLADLSRLRDIAAGQQSTSDGLNYLESFLIGVIDATLAAQNAVVAFESLGLGTCYIGAVRNDPAAIAAELGLPKEVFPVFGLTVGYPDPAVKTDIKPRLPVSKVLHREQYQTDRDFKDYNQTLRSFQTLQAMPEIDWTDQMSRRIATREALKNRDQLKSVIESLGFQLK